MKNHPRSIAKSFMSAPVRVSLTSLVGAVISCVVTIAFAESEGLAPGHPKMVAIKADIGGWWGRCNQCQKSTNPAYQDTVMIGEKSDEPKVKDQHFEMHKLKDGRVAFKCVTTGQWVGMCTDCVVNGTQKDFIFIHTKADKEEDIPSWCKFEIVKLSGDKVALKADNGKYVGRCTDCSPGAAYPESVTAHLDDTSEPYAQWEIVDVEG
jgi:hypothetical protein